MNNNIAFTLLASLIIGIFGATMAAVQFTTPSTPVFADGNGSPATCNHQTDPTGIKGSIGGNATVLSHTAPEGKIIAGVCIKTGGADNQNQTPTFPEGHSSVLGNGTYNDSTGNACYTVSGVGTQTVTVTKVGNGNNCKDLSHIDVVYGNAPTITSTLTPTATPSASPTPTVEACVTYTSVHTTNLSTWDLTQTRVTGHNELVTNGLHIWTEGTTSTDKAAGYYLTNFALSDAGSPSIEFTSFTGGRAGLQLVIDKNNDGTPEGILVYEPWVYGEGNFWSNVNLGISSGMGYTSFGTLNDILVANPDARIRAIGYSLGSGVLGDNVIKKITAGCVEYTFGLPPVTITLTPTATPEASLTPTITTTITPSVTTTVTPSITESPTPTPTTGAGPTATPTPGPVGGTTQSVLGTTDTEPTKSVLGASTLAGTGTFDRTMANVFAMTAILFFILSGAAYAKKNR